MHWSKRDISVGDHINLNLKLGVLENYTKKLQLKFKKLPMFLLNILEQGGILNKLKKNL
ncbi:MAG: hypothetical protein KGD63_12775 [Candidatus Lokiarchaeota archaeon]|nr:hypothetical protein [Candidatus Lokiarchaeota archaeon]